MGQALEKYVRRPGTTNTESKSIFSMSSPLGIAICKDNPFNFSNEYGYLNPQFYFWGNAGNHTVLTWTGKDGNLTFNRTINSLFSSELDRIDNERTFNSYTGVLLPYGFCKFFKGKPRDILVANKWATTPIHFNINGTGAPIKIYIFDPSTSPRFQLPTPLMTGDQISLKVEQHVTMYSYSIILKETRNQLGDGTCTSYPESAGYKSFAECVQSEAEGKVRQAFGCVPPWMSDKDRCTGPVIMPRSNLADLKWFRYLIDQAITGFFYKSDSCLLPCDRFSVQTIFRERSVFKSKKQASTYVRMFLDGKVQVDTLVPAVDFFTLIVEIGINKAVLDP